MWSSRQSVAGKKNEEEVHDLHGEPDGYAGHGHAADHSACGVDVGREDGDHHEGECQAGSAAPAGKKEADGTGNFEESSYLGQKPRVGQAGRDDADGVGYTEKVQHDAGKQQRQGDDDSQGCLRPSE